MSQRCWCWWILVLGWVGFGLTGGLLTAQVLEEPYPKNIFAPESAGLRGGFSTNRKTDDFIQAEAYSRWALPWDWEWCGNWSLRSWGELSLGYLSDREQRGFIGTFGPGFTMERKGIPVGFEFGTSPTFLSRHHYGETDFGLWFQFTTQAGLRWHINDRLSLGYRYQHMSNASLKKENFGLDLHMISVGLHF